MLSKLRVACYTAGKGGKIGGGDRRKPDAGGYGGDRRKRDAGGYGGGGGGGDNCDIVKLEADQRGSHR